MESENSKATSCCASCGATEGDGIKLRTCTACRLVQYCGVKCQKEHRPKHKRECKKRAAELRHELLFRQPESTCYGDCPICFLPLPLDQSKTAFFDCCGKLICQGCAHADAKHAYERKQPIKCPFCRCDLLLEKNKIQKRANERLAKTNDPALLRHEGIIKRAKGEFETAFTYLSRAAELGDAIAHYEVGLMYHSGRGVEKNESKSMSHLEQAAIGGHPRSRAALGRREYKNGRLERAVKHWVIGSNLGCDESLEKLKIAYQKGLISKDDFASALRAHKTAVDATKSKQREEGELAVKRKSL